MILCALVCVVCDRLFVEKYGTKDPALQDLVRETSSRRSAESSRMVSLSSANEDDDTDGATSARNTRSSPRKTKAAVEPHRRHPEETTSTR